jgi:hypothetical protein
VRLQLFGGQQRVELAADTVPVGAIRH